MNKTRFLENAWQKRDETTRELFVRYPRLLRPSGARQYLAYGPGWFRLVDKFLAGVNDRLSDDLALRFGLNEIKEKFSRMQIHYFVLPPAHVGGGEDEVVRCSAEDSPDFPFSEIDALKNEIEQRSQTTCFFCGEAGVQRRTRWMRVSCDACEQNLESP